MGKRSAGADTQDELPESEARARREIAARADVSRETLADLDAFAELVQQWTRKINLVSVSDRKTLWSRHILDSLALAELVPEEGLWTDIGSGGGFPAVPLAIISKHRGDALRFRLIESDRRKGVFLREAIRKLGLSAVVETARIEEIAPKGEQIISARALAPVGRILDLVSSFQNRETPLALLKGEGIHQELTEAARHWHMRYQSRRNTTTSRGIILLMQGYRRVSSSRNGEP